MQQTLMQQTPATHELKSWPEFFGPIAAGDRHHELRPNDRDFSVGDILLLREYDPHTQTYTGAAVTVTVTSMTSREKPCAVSGAGLHPDFCILSIVLTSSGRAGPGPASDSD